MLVYLSQDYEIQKYSKLCLVRYVTLITWINTTDKAVFKSKWLNGIAQNLYLTENWGNGR